MHIYKHAYKHTHTFFQKIPKLVKVELFRVHIQYLCTCISKLNDSYICISDLSNLSTQQDFAVCSTLCFADRDCFQTDELDRLDVLDCHTPEIKTLDEEVQSLLELTHGNENLTGSITLIRIADDLINLLNSSLIYPNDVSLVANILDGVIM